MAQRYLCPGTYTPYEASSADPMMASFPANECAIAGVMMPSPPSLMAATASRRHRTPSPSTCLSGAG